MASLSKFKIRLEIDQKSNFVFQPYLELGRPDVGTQRVLMLGGGGGS